MALFSLKKLYRRRETFTTLFFQSDGFGLFLWRKSARQGGLAFDSAGKKQKIKPFQYATFCSKRAISSVRRYTVSSVSPVIITSHVLTRNRYLISRTPLTCSGMTGNHTGLQGISCISQPAKRVNLTTGSKSKPDGRSIMWWKGIMTSSRKEDFQWEDNRKYTKYFCTFVFG